MFTARLRQHPVHREAQPRQLPDQFYNHCLSLPTHPLRPPLPGLMKCLQSLSTCTCASSPSSRTSLRGVCPSGGLPLPPAAMAAAVEAARAARCPAANWAGL